MEIIKIRKEWEGMGLYRGAEEIAHNCSSELFKREYQIDLEHEDVIYFLKITKWNETLITRADISSQPQHFQEEYDYTSLSDEMKNKIIKIMNLI